MIIDVIKNTIMISSFVLIMMLLLEFVNVQSHGHWLQKLQKHKWAQYLIAGFLGALPGCAGTFGVVSMYMHRFLSFGALCTALIATFGDEAFIMFALIPSETAKLLIIILLIGIVTGIIVDILFKNVQLAKLPTENHFEIHQTDKRSKLMAFGEILGNLRNISLPRAALIGGAVLIITGIFSGEFSHAHVHGEQCETGHIHDTHGNWGWEQISFLVVMLAGLFIIVRANEHFLEEHLWQHLIKKHFVKIFSWTFGALLLIELLGKYLHIHGWMESNQLLILFMAVIIGIIPQSGPHLVFVSLFIEGAIPFSTLMASAIVQDGHGALPLFAESKKSFFAAKAVNISIGLVVGLVGLYFI
jgi:hypothetical protein